MNPTDLTARHLIKIYEGLFSDPPTVGFVSISKDELEEMAIEKRQRAKDGLEPLPSHQDISSKSTVVDQETRRQKRRRVDEDDDGSEEGTSCRTVHRFWLISPYRDPGFD